MKLGHFADQRCECGLIHYTQNTKSWAFVCWKICDYSFDFCACDGSVKIFYFFLVQFWKVILYYKVISLQLIKIIGEKKTHKVPVLVSKMPAICPSPCLLPTLIFYTSPRYTVFLLVLRPKPFPSAGLLTSFFTLPETHSRALHRLLPDALLPGDPLTLPWSLQIHHAPLDL